MKDQLTYLTQLPTSYPLTLEPGAVLFKDDMKLEITDFDRATNTLQGRYFVDGAWQDFKSQDEFAFYNDGIELKASYSDADNKFKLLDSKQGWRIEPNFNSEPIRKLLVENVLRVQEQVLAVSKLEEDERKINHDTSEGYQVAHALRGYAGSIITWAILHSNGLKKSETQEITKMVLSLENLASSFSKMVNQETLDAIYTNLDNLQTIKDKLEPNPYINQQLDRLLQTGELDLVYGFTGATDIPDSSGHHEVLSIKFAGDNKTGLGRATVIIYNAGYGTEILDKSQLLTTGIREYHFDVNNKAELKGFLKLVTIRKLVAIEGVTETIFKKLDQEITSKLGKLIRKDTSVAQTRGNCTTRSTREYLKDNYRNIFDKMTGYISNPELTQKSLDRLQASDFSPSLSPSSMEAGPATLETSPRGRTSPKNALLARMNSSLLKTIEKTHSSTGIIQQAIDAEKHEMITSYIKQHHGTPLNTLTIIYNREQTTLLHYAIDKGNLELFKLLLDKGFTGSEKNGTGITAINHLINKGREDLLNEFTQRGKNLESLSAQNEDGTTPIRNALDHEHHQIAINLLETGVKLDPKDNNNYSIPHMIMDRAIYQEDQEPFTKMLSKIFSNYKIDIYQKDGSGLNLIDLTAFLVKKDNISADTKLFIAQIVSKKIIENFDVTEFSESKKNTDSNTSKTALNNATNLNRVAYIIKFLDKETAENLAKVIVRNLSNLKASEKELVFLRNCIEHSEIDNKELFLSSLPELDKRQTIRIAQEVETSIQEASTARGSYLYELWKGIKEKISQYYQSTKDTVTSYAKAASAAVWNYLWPSKSDDNIPKR